MAIRKKCGCKDEKNGAFGVSDFETVECKPNHAVVGFLRNRRLHTANSSV